MVGTTAATTSATAALAATTNTSTRKATAHGKPWTTQVAIAPGTPRAIHHVIETVMVPLNLQEKTQAMASLLPQLIKVALVTAGNSSNSGSIT